MEPNSKPAIILIHGFGCPSIHWRVTFSTLVKEGFNVHAIDLLGRGRSSKPGRRDGIEYMIVRKLNKTSNVINKSLILKNKVKCSKCMKLLNFLDTRHRANSKDCSLNNENWTNTHWNQLQF